MIPHFGSIALLKNQQYERYLPSAFDESMSLVQKVNKVIEHLNTTMDRMNELQGLTVDVLNEQTKEIQELYIAFTTLKEWLENEGAREALSVTLNEWFDTGKLAEIINNDVFNMKANQSDLDLTNGQLADTATDLEDRGINVRKFGFNGDGVTDDTQSIINTINHAKQNGYNKVVIPFTPDGFVVSKSIYVREGITIVSEVETVFRRNNFPHNQIIVGNQFTGEAIFILESHANVRGFVLYDPLQKYTLQDDTEGWVTGRPRGIQLGYTGYNAFNNNNVNYGNEIGNIAFIGILDGIVQHSSSENVENLVIYGLRGMPLRDAINIRRAYDVPRFKDIHFNLNSYGDLITGDKTIYYRKVAKTAETFKFGRVDWAILDRCFAYGIKYGVHFYLGAFTGDSGAGGGVTATATSFDVCHVGYQIDRSDMNFNISIVSGFVVPTVKIPGSKQAYVKFSGNAQNVNVDLVGVKGFGDTSPQLGTADHTGRPENFIVFETTGERCLVNASGWFVQHTGVLVSGESTAKLNLANFDIRNGHTPQKTFKGNVILKGTGNNSPDLIFENEEGSTWRVDNFGGVGVSRLRFTLGTVDTMTLNEDTGNLQLLKGGGTFVTTSPDGTKVRGFGVNNDHVPTVSGLPLLFRQASAPTSVTAPGERGHYFADNSFLYICTDKNVWRRIGIGTW